MKLKLENNVYDFLKKVAQIYLPALGTLYAVLAGIWHLPREQEVVATIVGVDTFLGAVLSLSTTSFNKSDEKFDGTINVDNSDPTKSTFALDLTTHPDEYMQKGEVLFKVQPAVPEPPAPNMTDPRLLQN